MKRLRRLTPYILLIGAILPLLCGCNQEDDVVEIFAGKTWRLSYIYYEGSYAQPYDVWNGDEEAYQKSMKLKEDTSNFMVEFHGSKLLDGNLGGTFSGRAVNATVVGYWTADGKTGKVQFSDVQWTGKDTDIYALEFQKGISTNVTEYTGDSRNLYLHYKDGQLLKVLALIAK